MARTVLAVTLNAAVDKTLTVSGFTLGRSHTAEALLALPGGKGINVARVLTALDVRVRVLGFGGGASGEAIRRGLDAEGIPHTLTLIDDDSRTCWAIIDPLHPGSTEVNERGPEIRPSEVAEFMATYRSLVRGATLVALSGSLPRGTAPSIYADLITEAWEHGVPCTLDTGNREALTLGLAAGPLLVKPNVPEAEALTGLTISSPAEADSAARALVEGGALIAAVSMGALGAVLRAPSGGWHALPPPLTPINTVGSGDAFLAGFIAAFLRALPDRSPRYIWDRSSGPREESDSGGFLVAVRDSGTLREALRLATAAGTANVLTAGAGQIRAEDARRLLPQVEIRELE